MAAGPPAFGGRPWPYLVVALVIVFIACFIIPGLIESMGVLAQTAQANVPVYYSNIMAWLTRFAEETT